MGELGNGYLTLANGSETFLLLCHQELSESGRSLAWASLFVAMLPPEEHHIRTLKQSYHSIQCKPTSSILMTRVPCRCGRRLSSGSISPFLLKFISNFILSLSEENLTWLFSPSILKRFQCYCKESSFHFHFLQRWDGTYCGFSPVCWNLQDTDSIWGWQKRNKGTPPLKKCFLSGNLYIFFGRQI